MTDTARLQNNQLLHLSALAAGLFAMGSFFFAPTGLVPQMLVLLIGIVAVIIGHRASRRPGSTRWVAILGLIIAYLQLFVAGGIMLVGAIRLLTSL